MAEDRVQQALDTACDESVNEKRQELIAAGQSDESFDEDSYYNQMLKKHQKRAERVSLVLDLVVIVEVIVRSVYSGIDRYAFEAVPSGFDDHLVGALQAAAMFYIRGGRPPWTG